MIRLLRIAFMVLCLVVVLLFSVSLHIFSHHSSHHDELLHSKEQFRRNSIARNLSHSNDQQLKKETKNNNNSMLLKETRHNDDEKNKAAASDYNNPALDQIRRQRPDEDVPYRETKLKKKKKSTAGNQDNTEKHIHTTEQKIEKKHTFIKENAAAREQQDIAMQQWERLAETDGASHRNNKAGYSVAVAKTAGVSTSDASTTNKNNHFLVKHSNNKAKITGIDGYENIVEEALADMRIKERTEVLQELADKMKAAKASDADILRVITAVMTRVSVGIHREGGGERKKKQPASTGQVIKVRDPLAHTPKRSSIQHLTFTPQVPYLGVLVDAGRHYYTITWLKRLIRYLHYMRFNLIHFRLTDDQAFNIRLDSHPEFAQPSLLNNPNGTVYTPSELRELVAYAHARDITIMPEINLPGHAGAWHGIPGMLVNCPYFICNKGYGIPLNINHPQLYSILKDIIFEVKDIFSTSPFFHFGGDEVHMANPCFREAGITPFHYEEFEQKLADIVSDAGIEEAVRWEMTGQRGPDVRVVSMEHYWLSRNYDKDDNGTAYPFFASQGLYFDANQQKDGHSIYEKTRDYLTTKIRPKSLPTAIIAGTFELGMDTWVDRNVMGRLLAVAMGASGIDFTKVANATAVRRSNTTRSFQYKDIFKQEYYKLCKSLAFDEALCTLYGKPPVPEAMYKKRWDKHWDTWKTDICDRLTIGKPARSFVSPGKDVKTASSAASEMFWGGFRDHSVSMFTEELYAKEYLNASAHAPKSQVRSLLSDNAVPNRGISLDLVRGIPGVPDVMERLVQIVDTMVELGFNLLQLRLMDDLGFVMQVRRRLSLKHFDNDLADYDEAIPALVEYAYHRGVFVMPEISITTRSGGWSESVAHVQCPKLLCNKGHGLAIDLEKPSSWPVVSVALKALRSIFSSKYIHLGFDERQEGVACFNEAKRTPHYNVYEDKLEEILRIERIPTEHVLRWENTEQESYPRRAGGVTHYRLSDKPTNASSPWFVSTRLELDEQKNAELDGWRIYKHTHALAKQSPTGIIASVGVLDAKSWKTLNIKGRLLALAMGLSDLEIDSIEDFRTRYDSTCRLLSPGYDCDKFGAVNATKSWWTMRNKVAESWVRQSCSLRTEEIVERFPRKGILVE